MNSHFSKCIKYDWVGEHIKCFRQVEEDTGGFCAIVQVLVPVISGCYKDFLGGTERPETKLGW